MPPAISTSLIHDELIKIRKVKPPVESRRQQLRNLGSAYQVEPTYLTERGREFFKKIHEIGETIKDSSPKLVVDYENICTLVPQFDIPPISCSSDFINKIGLLVANPEIMFMRPGLANVSSCHTLNTGHGYADYTAFKQPAGEAVTAGQLGYLLNPHWSCVLAYVQNAAYSVPKTSGIRGDGQAIISRMLEGKNSLASFNVCVGFVETKKAVLISRLYGDRAYGRVAVYKYAREMAARGWLVCVESHLGRAMMENETGITPLRVARIVVETDSRFHTIPVQPLIEVRKGRTSYVHKRYGDIPNQLMLTHNRAKHVFERHDVQVYDMTKFDNVAPMLARNLTIDGYNKSLINTGRFTSQFSISPTTTELQELVAKAKSAKTNRVPGTDLGSL